MCFKFLFFHFLSFYLRGKKKESGVKKEKARNVSTSSLRSAVTFIGKANSFKKIRRSRK